MYSKQDEELTIFRQPFQMGGGGGGDGFGDDFDFDMSLSFDMEQTYEEKLQQKIADYKRDLQKLKRETDNLKRDNEVQKANNENLVMVNDRLNVHLKNIYERINEIESKHKVESATAANN